MSKGGAVLGAVLSWRSFGFGERIGRFGGERSRGDQGRDGPTPRRPPGLAPGGFYAQTHDGGGVAG